MRVDSGEICRGTIEYDTFQRLAGTLHQTGVNTKLPIKALKALFGITDQPGPAYGEVPYQYRMSQRGWIDAKRKQNEMYFRQGKQ